MIPGVVTADLEAVLLLDVFGPDGKSQTVEAVIDTGFDGWLSLPPPIIDALGLAWKRRGRARLADGSECLFDIYEASLLWDGRPRRVVVDEADTAPLAGVALLEDCELKIEFRAGGTVSILPLAK